MSDFACHSRDADGAVVVALSGDVDLATSERVVAAVAARLVPRGRIVLDCSAVDFLDSCGLRGLLELRRLATFVEAVFVLAAPSVEVLRVLDLSGTRSMFVIADAAPPGAYRPTADEWDRDRRRGRLAGAASGADRAISTPNDQIMSMHQHHE